MTDGAHGPWSPLTVGQLTEAMVGASFRWWVSGGHALELHVGTAWRDHDDLDLGIRRQDAPALRAHLAAWSPFVAASGVVRPWDGGPLDEARHENNLWWRIETDGPWVLDTTLGAGDGDAWVYRRDPLVRRSWDEAVLRSPDGVPYLAPELQLLFKSTTIRPKDQVDAEHVLPVLDPTRRRALSQMLPADHPWQELLP